jgi:hypothetical protein
MSPGKPSPSFRSGVLKANKPSTVFALVHLLLLIAAAGYGFLSLARGNVYRFVFIFALLTAYYFLVLHENVKKELDRKSRLRGGR